MEKTTSTLNVHCLAILVFCFFSFNMQAQVPGDWEYAVKAGGANADGGRGIVVDASGNSYVVGYFDAAATFYGTPDIILNTNGNSDIFLAKYDPAGNVLWAVKAGSDLGDQGIGICLDNSGNTYITGNFVDTATFYGSSNIQLVSNGSNDIFIAKYDPSGNVLWAKKAGGAGADYGQKIKVDNAGNTYVTGFFPNDTLIFYGTPDISLTSNGVSDIFIAKFDPSGNVIWAKHAGGSGNDNAYGIAIDGLGNCYVTGSFLNTAYFYGPVLDSVVSQGGNDIFVAKFNVNGDVIWVQHAGSVFTDQASNITVDASLNCYITGNASNNCIFYGPPSNITMPSNGLSDIFIASYDAMGNLRWAKHAGGSSSDFSNGIFYNALDDHISICGYFQGTATFYGLTNINMTSGGGADLYIAEYDGLGNVLCAQRAGGAGFERAWDISGEGGNYYVAGEFSGTAVFPSSPDIAITSSVGANDALIAKWMSSCSLPSAIASEDAGLAIGLFPNPAHSIITLRLKGKKTAAKISFSVYDINGRQVYNSGPLSSIDDAKIDISGFSKGIYFIKIIAGTDQAEQKFVVE